MNREKRDEVRANIKINPNGSVHSACVVGLLDLLDLQEEEIRLLKVDLFTCSERLRELWSIS